MRITKFATAAMATAGAALMSGVTPADAAEAAAAAGPALETQYIFNTFSFLVHGFLVMWMAAGFAMLESPA